MNDSIRTTLAMRKSSYGNFSDVAHTVVGIKTLYKYAPNFHEMDADMKEALEMIAHKISRILHGDPYYSDSWHDIAGYATLVSDRLKKEEREPRK